ncbi:unnamed protein product [Oikopleura dioica]|uniref:Uncharacterized protein n=1 Tax=Oikopleura dioica TaxID=34765 RepID=E4Y3G6_OIKDI|nr:unnamed protein product [Oikopleura dioica]
MSHSDLYFVNTSAVAQVQAGLRPRRARDITSVENATREKLRSVQSSSSRDAKAYDIF